MIFLKYIINFHELDLESIVSRELGNFLYQMAAHLFGKQKADCSDQAPRGILFRSFLYTYILNFHFGHKKLLL